MARETKEHKCLKIIIENFKVYEVDFMNFKITDEQPLTYHHIIPRRDGGATTVKNGAVLTLDAHAYFHIIERKNYAITQEITRLFQELHKNENIPDFDYYEKIDFLLNKYEQNKFKIYMKDKKRERVK